MLSQSFKLRNDDRQVYKDEYLLVDEGVNAVHLKHTIDTKG